MIEYRVMKEERRSEYHSFQEPPDNTLPKEWNKNPEENPLLMLFNNPWISMIDLIHSDAFNQSYSLEVDMKKEYLLGNPKLENGILFPFWWKGTGKEFAVKFNEEYASPTEFITIVHSHKNPFCVLENLLCMSVEPLSIPREPDFGLWN